MSTSAREFQEIVDLRKGAARLVSMSLDERQELLRESIRGVEQTWRVWVEKAWEAKKIPRGDHARAEDILTGPVAVLRYLHLLRGTLADIARHGQPSLPGRVEESRGRLNVPVFPTTQLFDRLLFWPTTGHVRMQPGVTRESLFGDQLARVRGVSGDAPQVCLVLGAGNVSSIPITDALTKMFQHNQAVLLKMNPVNDYIGPLCEQAFAKLIEADLLRIVYGGADVGADLIASNDVDCLHITGSDQTHDAIVWGADPAEQARRKQAGTPLLTKSITSELGNVSPWIIVPGKYTPRQLRFQAENIAASITNNASFNCIATKMLITSRDWSQRVEFLDLLEMLLSQLPPRFAYYPGAVERFEKFSGQDAPSEYLPWTCLRDVEVHSAPQLFQQESFVGVFGETSLTADSAEAFLEQAVDFVNNQMWGTLSAAFTVPDKFQQQYEGSFHAAIDRLRYGIVGINQWPGVAFALMSTPWGAHPGSTLDEVQSGIGSVHNTFLLDRPEKVILSSPLTIFPKPLWFSTHRCPEAVADRLARLYLEPSLARLPAVLLNALRG